MHMALGSQCQVKDFFKQLGCHVYDDISGLPLLGSAVGKKTGARSPETNGYDRKLCEFPTETHPN